jgi:protein-tyrosine kinase
MSEIFEALRKAQREADKRRAQGPRAAEDVRADAGPPPAAPEPPAEDVRPAAPAPPKPPRRRRRRQALRWLPRWLGGPSQNGKGPADAVVLAPRTGTASSEQFRLLRTRIETVGPGTYMVTSALDREGKTLCTANLALTLSFSLGAGVIVVDADLRHPSIARWFGLPNRAGLVDCLLGEASWRDCLCSTEHERLTLLPAGGVSLKSTELLGSDAMIRLVAELKESFPRHYILLDAPPLLLTADPLVLARHSDHVLLVVRAGVTPRPAVLKAIETLGADRFLGVVFNGASDNVSNYYYYGRYPYGEAPKT